MKLDLREIIDVPGGRVSFSQELSTERLSSPSIVRYDAGPSAGGVVENTAGVLTRAGDRGGHDLPLRPLRPRV